MSMKKSVQLRNLNLKWRSTEKQKRTTQFNIHLGWQTKYHFATIKTDVEKKEHFLPHMEKYTNNNKAQIDGSKSKEKKIGFIAVFIDITRR